MSIAELCEIVPAWEMEEDEWLDERHKGIGGSEIAAVAGLINPKYGSPFSVWARKVQGINTFDGNDATDLGNLLERPVAEKFALDHGFAVVEWKVILRSKSVDWLSANVDFFVVEPSEQFPASKVTTWEKIDEPPGILSILECKTGALATPGSPADWANDAVPISYHCQVMWYLAATGLQLGYVACLLGGHGMQYRVLERDQAMIEGLIQIGWQFWTDYVIPQEPPPMDGGDATTESMEAMYPRSTPGQSYEGGADLWAAWEEFQQAKTAAEESDKARKLARLKVIAFVGEAEEATVDGVPILSYRNNRDSAVLDQKALKADHPEIFQKYLVSRPGSRVLRAMNS